MGPSSFGPVQGVSLRNRGAEAKNPVLESWGSHTSGRVEAQGLSYKGQGHSILCGAIASHLKTCKKPDKLARQAPRQSVFSVALQYTIVSWKGIPCFPFSLPKTQQLQNKL